MSSNEKETFWDLKTIVVALVFGGGTFGVNKFSESARFDPFTGSDAKNLQQQLEERSIERDRRQQLEIQALRDWATLHDAWARPKESEMNARQSRIEARLESLEAALTNVENGK